MKHPSKADTIQHYDARAIPQIEYNEKKHHVQGPQTFMNYSVTQNHVRILKMKQIQKQYLRQILWMFRM